MKKYGFSFSWKRAIGLSAAKGRLSRKIGIPLTKSGRQRKIGSQVEKMGGMLVLFLIVGICGVFGKFTSKVQDVKSQSTQSVVQPLSSDLPLEEAVEENPNRIWTSANGEFTTEARYLISENGKVKLEKLNGKVITVPIEKLIPEDRQFVLDREKALLPVQPKMPVQSNNDLWTKNNTPAWTNNLRGVGVVSKSQAVKIWANLLNDDSPLYTGVLCSDNQIKIYVNRSEWKLMNKFQATNHLMISALLPQNDNTVIEYIDDKSQESLASFVSKTKMGEIKVVHP